MERMKNNVAIIGKLYSQKLKVGKSNNPNSKRYNDRYINGSFTINTGDKDHTNLVNVRANFVWEYRNADDKEAGKVNETFTLLSSFLPVDGKDNTYINSGEEAPKLYVKGTYVTNDYYTTGQDGSPILMGGTGIDLGYVTQTDDERENYARFAGDILATKFIRTEEDNGDPKGIVEGYTFNWRNEISPVKITIRVPQAIDYFYSEGIEEQNPSLVYVECNFVNKRLVVEEEKVGVFGKSNMTRSTKYIKETEMYYADPVRGIGEEITMQEKEQLFKDRTQMLANKKAEYESRQNGEATTTAKPKTAAWDSAKTSAPVKKATPKIKDAITEDLPFNPMPEPKAPEPTPEVEAANEPAIDDWMSDFI